MKNFKTLGQLGNVFLSTVILLTLIGILAGFLLNFSMHQIHMASRFRRDVQARYIAEAGLSHAVAILAQNFDNKNNAALFPATAFEGGTYDVTVNESGGRVLLSSVGTMGDASYTATLEVEDLMPSALKYTQSAGGNISLLTIIFSDADITGDLFANGNVSAVGFWLSPITVNGRVYAGGTAQKWGNVTWTSATSNAGNITFPVYNFNLYRLIAQNEPGAPYYFNTNQVWNNCNYDTSANGGVVFVDGNVFVYGNNNRITGSLIVTGNIFLYGTLIQQKAASFQTYPAIMTETGNIHLLTAGIDTGRLTANGLVYAGQDFGLIGINTQVNVTGSILAQNNLWQGNVITDFDVVYQKQNPPGLVLPGGATTSARIKSYNR